MSKRKDEAAVIFRLPAEVKKKLQMRVLEEGTSVQELLEGFVYDYLGMKEEKTVLKGIMKVAQKKTLTNSKNSVKPRGGDKRRRKEGQK